MRNNTTGIILSGGKGTRMGGVEKAFIAVNGKSLIARKTEDLKAFCSEIIIVVNNLELYRNDDFAKCRIVEDINKDKGPLMGIYSGLINSANKYNFITAVDMPFFNLDLCKYMKQYIEDYDVVVSDIEDKLQPLFGFYSKECIDSIKASLEEGESKVRSFFEKVKVKYISKAEVEKYDEKMNSFININTLRDLEEGVIRSPNA
jgi:molybdenum cofactor guanylyltransferase